MYVVCADYCHLSKMRPVGPNQTCYEIRIFICSLQEYNLQNKQDILIFFVIK
jgi:hypothetical protein